MDIELALGQCLVFAGPWRTVFCVTDTDRLGKGTPPPGFKITPRIYVDLKNDPSPYANSHTPGRDKNSVRVIVNQQHVTSPAGD